MHPRAPGALLPLSVGVALLHGCPATSTLVEAPADAGHGDVDATTPHDRPDDPPPPGVSHAYRIEPADALLLAPLGEEAELVFRVVATDPRDGTEVAAPGAVWSLGSPSLGRMGREDGRFVSNGEVGGTEIVEASIPTATGRETISTTLSVRVEVSRVGPGVRGDAAARFGDVPAVEDDSTAASIAYPLDGAVMPQNVFPATIQWLRSAPGDLFRIRLETEHAQVTAYSEHSATDASSTKSWRVDPDAWRLLAQTDTGGDVIVSVDRLAAGASRATAGPSVTVRFAPGSVSGSMYYVHYTETPRTHHLYRIDDGTDDVVDFMPNPPLGCVGCHSVSRDGKFLAARLGGADDVGAIYDLSTDLGGAAPAPVYPPERRWYRSTWSPDNARLLVDTVDHRLLLVDPFTGVEVDPAEGSLPTAAAYPAWAPDGHAVAFASDVGGSGRPGFEYLTRSDLSVMQVTGPDRFGAPRQLARSADLPGGDAVSYPTWSADSQIIAFAHGGSNYGLLGETSLYATTESGGAPVRLDRASAGRDETLDAGPSFSPFCTGGYCWLAFTSKRPMGNEVAGTLGRETLQIWVTGIRRDSEIATLDGDPSSVPYWLPGQQLDGHNLYAQWAPRSCRADGEECGVDSECCSSICREDDGGRRVCTPPQDLCRGEGEPCGGGGCCEGLECIANACQDRLI